MEITHEKRGRGKPKLYGEKTRSLSFAVPISHYDELKALMEEELNNLKICKTINSYYFCDKCNNGTIEVITIVNELTTEIEIHKCHNCGNIYSDINYIENNLRKSPF